MLEIASVFICIVKQPSNFQIYILEIRELRGVSFPKLPTNPLLSGKVISKIKLDGF